MNYFILFLALLTYSAPPKVTGLGSYIIGITSPDSLKEIDFSEKDQPYIKGTITLPCTHIRTFIADTTEIEGISVTNLSLFFYDNKLFRISCEYSDELAKAFNLNYGKGIPRPTSRLSFCDQGRDKTMLIDMETWQNGDILAMAVHAKGYNATCQIAQLTRLTIVSQHLSALSSDCDLQQGDPVAEEIDEMMNR